MTAIDWSTEGKRKYEIGVDRGVLYVGNSPGVIWPGLISVSEAPIGGEITPYYLDGVMYHTSQSATEFQASINAYYSPEEFDVCEGIASVGGMLIADQPRKNFGLSYRTVIGNDLIGERYGYKIHLIYNALVGVAGRDHQTMGESADPETLSWPITAKPIHITGFKPTAHLVFDSTKTSESFMEALERILYGTITRSPHLPTITELSILLGFLIPPDYEGLIFDGGDAYSYSTAEPDVILDGGSAIPEDDIIDGGSA